MKRQQQETEAERQEENKQDKRVDENSDDESDLEDPAVIEIDENTLFTVAHVTAKDLADGELGILKPCPTSITIPLRKRKDTLDARGVPFEFFKEGSVTPAPESFQPKFKLMYNKPSMVISIPQHQEQLREFLGNYMVTALELYGNQWKMPKYLLAGIKLMITGAGQVSETKKWLSEEAIAIDLDLEEGADVPDEVTAMLEAVFSNMSTDPSRLHYFWAAFGPKGASIAREYAGCLCQLKHAAPQESYRNIPKPLKGFIQPLLAMPMDTDDDDDEDDVIEETPRTNKRPDVVKETSRSGKRRRTSSVQSEPTETPTGHTNVEHLAYLSRIVGPFVRNTTANRIAKKIGFNDSSATAEQIVDYLDDFIKQVATADSTSFGQITARPKEEKLMLLYELIAKQMNNVQSTHSLQPPRTLQFNTFDLDEDEEITDPAKVLQHILKQAGSTTTSQQNQLTGYFYDIVSTGWSQAGLYSAPPNADPQTKRLTVTTFLNSFFKTTSSSQELGRIVRSIQSLDTAKQAMLELRCLAAQVSNQSVIQPQQQLQIFTSSSTTTSDSKKLPLEVLQSIANSEAEQAQLRRLSRSNTFEELKHHLANTTDNTMVALMTEYPSNYTGTSSLKSLIDAAQTTTVNCILEYVNTKFQLDLTTTDIRHIIAGHIGEEKQCFKLERLTTIPKKLQDFNDNQVKTVCTRYLDILHGFWSNSSVAQNSFSELSNLMNGAEFNNVPRHLVFTTLIVDPLCRQFRIYRTNPTSRPPIDATAIIQAIHAQFCVAKTDLMAQAQKLAAEARAEAAARGSSDESKRSKKPGSRPDDGKQRRRVEAAKSSIPHPHRWDRKMTSTDFTTIKQAFPNSRFCFNWAFNARGCTYSECTRPHKFPKDTTIAMLQQCLPTVPNDHQLNPSEVEQ
mmetsp:Transcript_4885/g.7321  ORF Transcript_4885/g.7321 Transcript_4885/m.7321 type:complete len:904 (+) Transcript_4885:43-2754(+)